MDYSTAKTIRGKKLSSMITDKIVSGGGVGASVKQAISEKMKAKVTGVKEKFDPMNVAKFLTGGSNLAAAVVGRLTGRKKSDIEYFTNRGNKTATRISREYDVIGQPSGDSLESIKSLFSMIKKNHEEDMKLRDTERTFREERVNEEDRRHQEFLNVLKEFTGATATVVAPTKEEGGGILDFIKSIISNTINEIKGLIASAIDGVMKLFSWISELKILARIAPWLSNLASTIMAGNLGTILAFLLPAAAAGALLFLLSRELEEIRKNPNDPKYANNPFAMVLRGEAATLAEAGQKNIQRAQKETRRPDVERFVNSDATDEELITNVGADRATLKQWLQDNPNPTAVFKPEKEGEIAKQEMGRRFRQGEFRRSEIQEQNYTPQTPSMEPATEPAPSAQTSSAATTPVTVPPMSSDVYDRSAENINLNLPQSFEKSAQPVVTNSVTNTSTDQPMPATASTRDDTDILNRIFRQSMSRY